jgi:hypothetical protein
MIVPSSLNTLWKHHRALTRVELDFSHAKADHFKTLSNLPPLLVSLNIRSSQHATDESLAEFPLLPQLRHLDFHHGMTGFQLTDATFIHLVKQCPNLRFLSFFGLHQTISNYYVHEANKLSEQALLEILSLCPQLEYLDLSAMKDLTDATLQGIATYLPRLRFLNLWCDTFTKAGLKDLGKKCQSLRFLNISWTKFKDKRPRKEEILRMFPQLYLLEDQYLFPRAFIKRAGLPYWSYCYDFSIRVD